MQEQQGQPTKDRGTPPPGGTGARTKLAASLTGDATDAGSGGGEGKPPVKRSWMETHGRDLRFLLIFAVLMGIYYAATTTAAVKERFFPWYLTLNADASVVVLHGAGIDYVKRVHHGLNSDRGSIAVERGCDAVEPTALFVSAVLASPVPWLSKIPAVFVGTLILAVVNIVRIVSLFLSAVYWRAAFDILHLDVWQAAFILLAILLWALWASWAVRRSAVGGVRVHATP